MNCPLKNKIRRPGKTDALKSSVPLLEADFEIIAALNPNFYRGLEMVHLGSDQRRSSDPSAASQRFATGIIPVNAASSMRGDVDSGGGRSTNG